MKLKKIKTKKDISGSDNQEGYLIDADEKVARSIIASLGKTDKIVAVLGRDGNFNRRVLETLKINYLVSPELGKRKDTLKQRDSGLNHVLGKIAAGNKIDIVIDYDEITGMKSRKEKALRLARIIQNIKICRRAKCNIKIWSLDNEIDEKVLRAFGFSLGMSSQQVSGSM